MEETNAIWDSLYETECKQGFQIDRNGFCVETRDLIHHCSHASNFDWKMEDGDWYRLNMCNTCSQAYHFLYEDGIAKPGQPAPAASTRFYPPTQNHFWWQQSCYHIDCKEASEDGSRCNQCHYFPYPEEGRWDPSLWDTRRNLDGKMGDFKDWKEDWGGEWKGDWAELEELVEEWTGDWTELIQDLEGDISAAMEQIRKQLRGTVKVLQGLPTADGKDIYFPINIFLNPFDGRCTADCAAEGRHYVNPFSYNPKDVVDWEKAYRRDIPADNFRHYPEWTRDEVDDIVNDRRRLD